MIDEKAERERDGFPDRLRKIVERAGDSLCTACESRLAKRHFTVGMRHLCWVCAKEIAYGVIPPGLPLQQFGGLSGPVDEDSNGGRSNAMRALEDS